LNIQRTEYQRRITNTDSEKERKMLMDLLTKEESEFKDKMRTDKDKLMLLTKERIEERKAYKRDRENKIK